MSNFERQRQMSNYQLDEFNHKTSLVDLISTGLEGNNKEQKKQEHKVTI